MHHNIQFMFTKSHGELQDHMLHQEQSNSTHRVSRLSHSHNTSNQRSASSIVRISSPPHIYLFTQLVCQSEGAPSDSPDF
jgi:hypothetical protein